MQKLKILLLPLVFSSVTSLSAEEMDGGALYKLYCSACHGAAGQGGAGGTAPPLANSPWVQGDSQRAIKLVLHGLRGEVEVAGKSYNLVMPPQGAVLDDKKISRILSYVRGNWGNNKKGMATVVSEDQVAQVRKATSSQSGMILASDLLKQHPLPVEQAATVPVKGLIMHTYYKEDGVWQQMPDFTNLKANAVEEEHKGTLSLADQDPKRSFAVKWDGRLELEQAGQYEFSLRADDGARVYVNDILVAAQELVGAISRPAKVGRITLAAGAHDYRVEYFQAAGGVGLELMMKAPSSDKPIALHRVLPKVKVKPKKPEILLKSENGEAVSYRNFVKGASTRAISYGYPEGINLLFSQETCNVQRVWKGEFMDAAIRWIGRGIGRSEPSGIEVVSLNPVEGPRVTIQNEELKVKLHKIVLDKRRYPTFHSRVEGHPELTMTDRYQPMADGSGFMRRVELQGAGITSVHIPIKLPSDKTLKVSCKQMVGDLPRYVFPVSSAGNVYEFEYRW